MRGRCAAALVTAALLIAGASACRDAGGSAATTLAKMRAAGVARVGFANEAPFAYLDPASGELRGEAPAVARAVFAALGVDTVEGVLTEFGSLIPGLKAGRFDVIAAGMYVTPARCREIAFSEPSYAVGEAFLVRPGNPRALHGYADVQAAADVKLGVMAGAVEHGYARAAGIPAERVVVFPDAPSGVAGLRSGRIDAFAGTALTVRDLLSKLPDGELEQAKPFRDTGPDGRPRRGYGAFGFRRTEAALRTSFDRELGRYLGSPPHRAAVAPYGFTTAELPGDVTTAELCAGD